MSRHDTVYHQGHDVTLQNQFFLMGISTALQRGIASEGQCMVEGVERDPARGMTRLLLFGLSHIENIP